MTRAAGEAVEFPDQHSTVGGTDREHNHDASLGSGKSRLAKRLVGALPGGAFLSLEQSA